GNNSVKLNGGAVGQRVTLEAGKKYKFSVMMYPTVFYASGITMGFYDATKTYPASNSVKVIDVRVDWTGNFAEQSVILDCTATQEYLVEVWVPSGSDVWVDNASVTETDEEEIINNPSIDVDYTVTDGTYNKDKLLNVSRGGYFVNRNKYWMPSYYDKYVEDGINMVRMDWVTSDEYYHVVSRDENGKLQYDFTKLDEIIMPLLERGITPYMCMTGTPEAIGGVIEPPWGFVGRAKSGISNLGDYAAVIKAYVQHYKDLGYTGWYWESHNEPESGEWGSAYQVAEQYGVFAKAVKEVDSTAKVGGIGFRNGDVNKDAGWKTAFFSYLQSNTDVPLDYISIHEYNEVTTFSSGDAYQTMAAEYGRADIPIIYSEYNYDWTVNSPGSNKDTNYNAAYISKRLFSALGQDNVDYVFYFTPSDAQNPTVLLNGDSGLYTINGHRKAASNVFNMLNDMEPEMLSSEEDIKTNKTNPLTGFATKNSETQRVTMFAFNYTDSEQDFEFNVDNLPYSDKNVKATVREISENSGNYAADYFNDLGGYSVTPHELPTEKVTVTEGMTKYEKTITMPAYSVFEIILEPTDEAVTEEYTKEQPKPEINLAFKKTVTASSEDAVGENTRVGVISDTQTQKQYWYPSYLTDGQRLALDMVNEGTTAVMGYRSESFDSADNEVTLTVDLSAYEQIDEVILSPMNDVENDGTGFPVDFKIQVSEDGLAWTDVVTETGYTLDKTEAKSFEFEKKNVRYVRLDATKLSATNDGDYRLMLTEFEVNEAQDAAGSDPSYTYDPNAADSVTVKADTDSETTTVDTSSLKKGGNIT
ncbi:MAG: discoidin domain-containing protein, partial [Hominilimicola sp.]